MFRILSYCFASVVFIAIVMISRPKNRPEEEQEEEAAPKEVEQSPLIRRRISANIIGEQATAGQDAKADNEEQVPDLNTLTPEIKSVKFCIYSKRFWQYYFIMIGGNFFITFFAFTMKIFGESNGIKDHTLTWAAGVGGGFVEGLGGFTCGSLQDKFQFKWIAMIIMLVSLSMSVSIYWVV